MVHNIVTGRVLSAKEMRAIKGGEPPKRKNVCVICGPGDVHCASVLATAICQVFDYVAAPPSEPEGGVSGWMGCKDGSEEDYSQLNYTCA